MSARDFAIQAHGDQMYGEEPYIVHLDAVAAIVAGWGFTGTLEVAAWLHDTLEDTEVTRDHLVAAFGERVAQIVEAVTGEGVTRPQRMASIYAKVQADGSAAVVKLADRIANLNASAPGSRHAERYIGEHDGFAAAIRPHVPAFAWDRYIKALMRLTGED